MQLCWVVTLNLCSILSFAAPYHESKIRNSFPLSDLEGGPTSEETGGGEIYLSLRITAAAGKVDAGIDELVEFTAGRRSHSIGGGAEHKQELSRSSSGWRDAELSSGAEDRKQISLDLCIT
jgi:hypothetical protein